MTKCLGPIAFLAVLSLICLSVAAAEPTTAPESTYTLHPASTMVRIGGPHGIEPPAANTYTLHLAQNEHQAIQIQVRRRPATAQGPLAVVPKLKHSGAATGSPTGDAFKTAVELTTADIYQVLDINYTGPAENLGYQIPKRNIGWIPDVCLPLGPSAVATAQERTPDAITVLFDFHVRPGRLVRTATIKYQIEFSRGALDTDLPVATLELTVNVHPITLPVRLPFKTGVTWDYNVDKYLGRKLTEKERLAYLDFFCDYRLTPAAFFGKGMSLSEAEVKRVLERGGNLFQMFHIGGGGDRPLTDKQKADLAPKLREWRQAMKSAGALEYCVALIGDEPPPKALPTIRANALWLKQQWPELKIWMGARPQAELMDVVDIWDAITAGSTDHYRAHAWSQETLEMARKAPNKPEMWWFLSYEPYAPHPNVRLDDLLVDGRAIGYLSYAAGMNGFEYVWATDWAANATLKDTPWPAKASKWLNPTAGHGVLAYPGDDGLPIPSLRLLNLRDGMQDWAIALMAGEEGRKISPKNPRDPAELAQGRAAILKYLAEKK